MSKNGEFWSLTQSQVYRELVTMTEAGLLEAGERGRRDRRPYMITEAGRAAFSAWIDRGPSSATIRIPLLLTVLFGRHLPSTRLAGILAHHHELHVDRLAHYDSLCAAATAEPNRTPMRWRCSTSGVAMNAPCWSGLPGCRRS